MFYIPSVSHLGLYSTYFSLASLPANPFPVMLRSRTTSQKPDHTRTSISLKKRINPPEVYGRHVLGKPPTPDISTRTCSTYLLWGRVSFIYFPFSRKFISGHANSSKLRHLSSLKKLYNPTEVQGRFFLTNSTCSFTVKEHVEFVHLRFLKLEKLF